MKSEKNREKEERKPADSPIKQPMERIRSAEGWKRAHQKRRIASRNAKDDE